MATDATPPVVRLERRFPANRAQVFEAFTRPEILKLWWGPPGGEATGAEIDLRVGGGYRFAARDRDGHDHVVFGTYREINPPERLVFTWAWEGGDESVVQIDFRDDGAGTRMILEHDGLPPPQRATHRKGWMHVLDRLETNLKT